MKRSFILLFAMLISFNTLVISYASYTASMTCEEGEALVCFEKSSHTFHIEENAQLLIYVDNENHGKALIEIWNQSYPEFFGKVSYTLDPKIDTDLRYVSIEEASFRSEEWLSIESSEQFIHSDLIARDLNGDGLIFLEMAGEGFAFISNLNSLEAQGFSLEDLDQDGRIDAIDQYEEILALDLVEMPYVVSLLEPYGFYPYLSAFEWQLFMTQNAYEPGFEDEKLLKALEWFSNLPMISIDEEIEWAYPNVLENNDFGFSMVASWMFVDELEAKHQANWQVSSFPMIEASITPTTLLTEVNGFVISKQSEYPSASHELLRLIQSNEGLKVFYESTDKILLASLNEINALNLEQSTRLEFSKAFTQARSEPMIAFKNETTQSAFELYYDLDLMNIIRDLSQKKISPKEAQLEMMKRADAWLYEHERELIYDQYQ